MAYSLKITILKPNGSLYQVLDYDMDFFDAMFNKKIMGFFDRWSKQGHNAIFVLKRANVVVDFYNLVTNSAYTIKRSSNPNLLTRAQIYKLYNIDEIAFNLMLRKYDINQTEIKYICFYDREQIENAIKAEEELKNRNINVYEYLKEKGYSVERMYMIASLLKPKLKSGRFFPREEQKQLDALIDEVVKSNANG